MKKKNLVYDDFPYLDDYAGEGGGEVDDLLNSCPGGEFNHSALFDYVRHKDMFCRRSIIDLVGSVSGGTGFPITIHQGRL